MVAVRTAHRTHGHPADRRRARRGARAGRAPRRRGLRPRALLSALAGARDGAARGARVLGTARRPARVGLRRVRGPDHAGDPRGAARTGSCGATACPAARCRTTSRARCDRVIAEVRAVEGDVALVAHGHILRALAARWIDAPVGLRRAAAPGDRRGVRARPTSARSPSSAAGTASRRAGRSERSAPRTGGPRNSIAPRNGPRQREPATRPRRTMAKSAEQRRERAVRLLRVKRLRATASARHRPKRRSGPLLRGKN